MVELVPELGKNKNARYVTKANWGKLHDRVLALANFDMGATEIAKRVGTCRNTIYRITGSDVFKERLAAAKNRTISKIIEKSAEKAAEDATLDEARDILKRYAAVAATKLTRIAEYGDTKDKVQMEACQDILDRVNVRGKEIIETHQRQYTPEEIERAKGTVLEVETITARLSNSTSRFVLQDNSASTEPQKSLDGNSPVEDASNLSQTSTP